MLCLQVCMIDCKLFAQNRFFFPTHFVFLPKLFFWLLSWDVHAREREVLGRRGQPTCASPLSVLSRLNKVQPRTLPLPASVSCPHLRPCLQSGFLLRPRGRTHKKKPLFSTRLTEKATSFKTQTPKKQVCLLSLKKGEMSGSHTSINGYET